MDRELLDYLNQQFGEVREQIQGLRQETAQQFQKTAEQIRHLHVLIEGGRGNVKLVAEGVVGANEKLDSARKEGAREIEEARLLARSADRALDIRMDRLDVRVTDVEARVVHLEANRG